MLRAAAQCRTGDTPAGAHATAAAGRGKPTPLRKIAGSLSHDHPVPLRLVTLEQLPQLGQPGHDDVWFRLGFGDVGQG
jgi:hypothetical protein